ncbi:MAG: ASCH domain-containing protein [Thermoleophilia bacterium]
MIFSRGLHELVLDGRKTQTRRPGGDTECRYRAGRTYAVQPARTARSVGRIMVTDVRREYVQDITEDDARAEGFADRAAFLDRWRDLYGWRGMALAVWVITFRLERSGP